MAERESNPLVDQIRRGGVPLEVRMMAAEGALPLKPFDLIELLEVMGRDADPAVAQRAGRTFAEMDAAMLQPILAGRETSAAVLAWALAVRSESRLLEAVLQNPSTPDEAIAAEARRLPEGLAELVVINQTRLLRCPPLLENIEANPGLSRDQRRRLAELRETFSIGVSTPVEAAPAPTPAAPASVEVVVEAPATDPAPAAGAADENSVAIPPEEAETLLADAEKGDEKAVSNLRRLFTLTTGQKIKAALTEDAQTRTFLIRDPNRLVALAVLGSPKITEAEIEGFSAMKNVSDEVLRRIGTNRDWTKKYTVINSLVKNPRTPLPIAMGFIARLQPRDLKAISVDRNVPEAIRRSAQRFVKAAVQGGTKN